MKIGIPKEIKDQEFRVGLTPASVRVCSETGHQVFIETEAGLGAGFSDDDYLQAGGHILSDAKKVWDCEMIVKVKEPLSSEYEFLKSKQLLFTYLHLAADRKLTERLVKSGVMAIAYETVELSDKRLPLLTPMSKIAGRLSVQFGARFLEKQQGGRGGAIRWPLNL